MSRNVIVARGFKTTAAAAYIGMSASWLRKKRMRAPGDPGDPGPAFLRTPDGNVLYLREALDSWLDNCRTRSA
jgi:hypothetical protein